MASMALTVAQIDAAITVVTASGQSYTMPDGTQVTRANLAELQAMRQQVQAETASDGTKRKATYQRLGFGRPW